MSLLVSITKASGSVRVSESSKSFDTEGGTIGRGAKNSWALEDPERYLSTCHCQISNENGQYFITDQSTNGTFLNGSPNPIGKGAKLPLNDGDTFIIGDYEFLVKSSDSDQSPDPFAGDFSSDPFAQDNFAFPSSSGDDLGSGSGSSNDPFASAHVSASDSLFGGSEQEMDPLAALDKAQGKQQINAGFDNNEDPFSAPSFSDQADPLNQQISWPDAVSEAVTDSAGASASASAGAGGIPDDWDDDFASPAADSIPQSIPLTTPPVTPKPAQVPDEPPAQFKSDSGQQKEAVKDSNVQYDLQDAANAKIQAELDLLKQQLDAQQRGGHTEVTVDTSLVDSLGLQNHNLTDSEITKINHLAGDVIKEMVRGLMQVLGSRGSIKNEFRMQVTTIQPVENNPLKFSANVEDALENMFVKKGKAFKKPVEAVQEGFESVAEHQVAILAGIKSAFKSVIERFDPALLEERFSKQSSGGFIPGSQKAKNWDLYNQYYNDMVGDLDDSFHYLFGDDFVRAYEEQLQKMMISKKAKKQH